MRRLRPLAIALLLPTVAGCVDRHPSAREQRDSFDRRGLATEVLAALPEGIEPLPEAQRGRFDGALELLAVRFLPETPPPGSVVTVELYLRVLQEPDEERLVFAHLEDRAGRVARVVGDHAPLGGRYPAWAFRPGEVLRDSFPLAIPPYTSPGTTFDLWIGLYQGDARAPVTAAAEARVGPGNRLHAGAFVSR